MAVFRVVGMERIRFLRGSVNTISFGFPFIAPHETRSLFAFLFDGSRPDGIDPRGAALGH